MARDKTQLLRLVFIDRQIREGMQSGQLANCSTMAAEYEVSSKSIMRDIDYLRYQRDAPIAYDSVRRGYYYSEENYRMPAISINESDLFSICIARQALRQHENTPLYRKLVSVFKKIEQALPDKVTVDPGWVDDRMSVIPDRRAVIDHQVWDNLTGSLKSNRRLRIVYLKPTADLPTDREVDPYHMVSFQGDWYLAAFCHQRGKVLIFAVSRIKKAELLDVLFKIPDDFNPDLYLRNCFGIFPGEKEYDVKIFFEARHAPYVREREWHASQVIEENFDGSLILSLQVGHLYEIKRWILSWGSGVKVLSPLELASDVLRELRESVSLYN
ncbi:MAG: WYL domain-containing protein [Proteobacteria bacterium]|nr:WYL domain-containing protein [Pseudomonadota bacterium]MBU1715375.1 WYL domain-containing protein [Pseudomonadota bacterium]